MSTMLAKPLIVGEAPGPSGSGPAVGGRIGRRLATLLGMNYGDFGRYFARTNVLTRWPGSNGKGSTFPHQLVRGSADVISHRFRYQRHVLLLGKRVAKVFGFDVPYLTNVRAGRACIYVIPHPSGVNRWYNPELNRRRLHHFLTDVVASDRAGRLWWSGTCCWCRYMQPGLRVIQSETGHHAPTCSKHGVLHDCRICPDCDGRRS